MAPSPSRRSIYMLHGLAVESPIELPCPRALASRAPDVQFREGGSDDFARARTAVLPAEADGSAWLVCRRLDDGATYLRWRSLFEFLISLDGRQITYRSEPEASPEAFTVYLLGHVLSFSLVALGVDPLHGTVVDVGGQAVAFLGDCGYGKSTLGAAFLARGCAIVTDDLVALRKDDDGWSVNPGIPRLKLFPAAARRLLHRDGGPRMNPATTKLVLPLDGRQSASRPVPLKACYVLSPPSPDSRRRPRGVTIRPLSGKEAFLETVRAAFNLFVEDRSRLVMQFDLAAQLAARVPLRSLTYPRSFSRLPAVCDAVLADLSA